MDEVAKEECLETLRRLCREQGLRCTVQRRVILEAALDLDNHPTADQIFELVAERIRGISRTTVYRNLENLVRMGLITKACHPGRVARYDRRTELHHHLICLHCDSVVDISDARLDALQIPNTSAFGFEVHDFRVQLRGICRRCRAQQRKGESS
jgi:Fur family peroxide stress response transcriptional regulator